MPRLLSLDALRGFDMLMIMGFGPLVINLCVALGWGADCALAQQFRHVEWHGLHFEDTIFPLFLFLAGVSWPFSLASRRAHGDTTAAILRKIVSRCAVLVLLGFVYNGLLKFDFANMCWGAVLVRIGIAWAVAAVLSVFVGLRGRIAIAVAILLAHWAICAFMTAPDAAGFAPLSMKGCFAGWLDRMFLPGRLTQPGVIANQGILSTFPAIVTAMLGVFAGELLRREDLTGGRKAAWLALGAAGLVCAGLLVAFGCGRYSIPHNKILWSASFTLTVGGYSAAMLSLFYWLIDVRGWWKRTLFFRVIGMNSITIYVAQWLIPFKAVSEKVLGGFAGLLGTSWSAVVLSAGYVTICWLFLWFLYRKNTFLKV